MDDLIKATQTVSLNSPMVISSESNELPECIEHISRFSVLALDCEGVDLGRLGKICLIQLSTPERFFLFDVHDVSLDTEMVSFLKSVLESPDVTKIIHDCKMDADALFHILDITLRGVHDTQSWDLVMRRNENNLNRTLIAYGCSPNAERDHSVYERNVAFWATRPLTSQMIDWAAGDVKSLFDLRDAQLATAACGTTEEMCSIKSAENASFLREKIVHTDCIQGRNVGKFIGKGGSNLRQLRERIPGVFFQLRGRRGEGDITVYAEDTDSLNRAIAALRRYK